jgi:hypothetical protein
MSIEKAKTIDINASDSNNNALRNMTENAQNRDVTYK